MLKPISRKTNKAMLTKLLAGIGGLLAAAISLGYSLYEKRQAEIIPQVAAATPIDAGRWKVSLNAAVSGGDMPNGSHVAPGSRAIAIDLVLENLSAESSNIYRDLIKLQNIPDAPNPQFYLMRDKDILWDMQPMMPEAVKAIWQVPADLTLPKQLKVKVEGEKFKPRDNLYAAPGWFSAGSVAEVALPLAPAASAPTGAEAKP
ncbi:hypothetical protein ACRQ1B_09680 [Rhizobium panacihumi]|uniref:hypothetical protein n=1 Tax=Rhizobium panacihumi TaxID=2008450 RepID=UPI003D7A8212